MIQRQNLSQLSQIFNYFHHPSTMLNGSMKSVNHHEKIIHVAGRHMNSFLVNRRSAENTSNFSVNNVRVGQSSAMFAKE